jgi:hypothetical protein
MHKVSCRGKATKVEAKRQTALRIADFKLSYPVKVLTGNMNNYPPKNNWH